MNLWSPEDPANGRTLPRRRSAANFIGMLREESSSESDSDKYDYGDESENGDAVPEEENDHEDSEEDEAGRKVSCFNANCRQQFRTELTYHIHLCQTHFYQASRSLANWVKVLLKSYPTLQFLSANEMKSPNYISPLFPRTYTPLSRIASRGTSGTARRSSVRPATPPSPPWPRRWSTTACTTSASRRC